VIAAEAGPKLTWRIARAADAAMLEQKFAGLKSFDPDCSIEISGGINRPPMERTEGTVRYLECPGDRRNRRLAFGGSPLPAAGLTENFTSALGVPRFDGLGA